jgi:hypothetical protein
MQSFIQLQNFDELTETEKIVTAFSAVLKTNSTKGNVQSRQSDKITSWQEQMYE